MDEVNQEVLQHRYGAPVLENRIVHERSKKAGTHHVMCVASCVHLQFLPMGIRYGAEYAAPAPSVDMVRGRRLEPTPLVTFTFRYRPRSESHFQAHTGLPMSWHTLLSGILLANDIIPRPRSNPSIKGQEEKVDIDPKTAAQIRRLEVGI